MVEGYQSKMGGAYTSLSDQMTLDCSGAGDCRGGWHTTAMSWIVNNNNLAATANYPYSAVQGYCQNRPSAQAIRVSHSWTASGASRMVTALNNGPVIFFLYNFHGVAVEGYKNGVLVSEPTNGLMAMNHVVVGTGYTANTREMRNSWGNTWGEQGYFAKYRTDTQVADIVITMSAAWVGQQAEVEE